MDCIVNVISNELPQIANLTFTARVRSGARTTQLSIAVSQRSRRQNCVVDAKPYQSSDAMRSDVAHQLKLYTLTLLSDNLKGDFNISGQTTSSFCSF